MMGMMTGMAIWMLLWALVLAVLLGFGIRWLARHSRSRQSNAEPSPGKELADEEPIAILRRRYAAGEIEEDEYLTRLSGLSQR